MLGRPAFLVAVAIVASATPCRAGWISELCPQPRVALDRSGRLADMPAMIELSGLTGLGTVQLVIVDAGTGVSRGIVRQVINVTAPVGDWPAALGVRVATAGPWPANVPPLDTAPAGWVTALSPGASFDLSRPRTILLLDRVTGLVPLGDRIPAWPVDLGGAVALDVLCVAAPGASVRPLGDEPLFRLAGGDVMVRPNQPHGDPWPGRYLIGAPDPTGLLAGVSPLCLASPGLANPAWQPSTLPEPASAAYLLVLATILTRRPAIRRRPAPALAKHPGWTIITLPVPGDPTDTQS